jgi:hypothetical protein
MLLMLLMILMRQGGGVPVPSTLKPAVGLHVSFKELELSLLREVTHLKTLQGCQII